MTYSKTEFEQLLQQHRGLIAKVARAYCSDEHERQDVQQEIAIQVWQHIDNYRPEFAFTTWLYRISLNVAISYYRRHRQPNFEPLSDITPAATDDDLTLLYRFLAQQNEINRAVLLMYLDNLANVDIAANLGLSESNISTRLSRIKVSFKQFLSGDE